MTSNGGTRVFASWFVVMGSRAIWSLAGYLARPADAIVSAVFAGVEASRNPLHTSLIAPNNAQAGVTGRSQTQRVVSHRPLETAATLGQ